MCSHYVNAYEKFAGKMPQRQADVMSEDYYRVLGLEKSAAEADIKRAYKKLALQWHPDKNQENRAAAEEKFKRISEAYACLSDSEKRKLYDTYGKRGLEQGSGMGGGFRSHMHDPEEVFRTFFSSGGFEDDFGGHPFFGSHFGGMGGFGGFDGHGFRSKPRCGQPQNCGSRCRNDEPPVHVIPDKTKVLLHSLRGSPELNNMHGTIAGFEDSSDRYTIKVDGNDREVLVKPGNFSQMPENVKIFVSSRPDLQNVNGDVVSFTPSSGRYGVRTATGTFNLEISSLRLAQGQRVHLQGLENVQWNELSGKICREFDGERYEVEVKGGRRLRLRPLNLRL